MKNGNGNGKAKEKITKRTCIRALLKEGYGSGPVAQFLRVPQQYVCSTVWLDKRPGYEARKAKKRAHTREFARRRALQKLQARPKRHEARA